MVLLPQDWPWSSYRATTGFVEAPKWLNTDWVLSAFGSKKKQAVSAYRHFVRNGKNLPSPLNGLRNQIYLGGEGFVQKMNALIDESKDLSEVPSSQRRLMPKTLSEYNEKATSRNEAIKLAYKSGGYSLKQIGDYFGLHYTSVSRIVRDAQ